MTVTPAELIPLRTTCQMTCEEPAADNKWESPPYNIHNFDNSGMRENRQAGLGWKTIAPSARKWLWILFLQSLCWVVGGHCSCEDRQAGLGWKTIARQ
jgi:3-methyladenine DNA glycosylase Tag